jgi:A/G-specific adenine glycosylase
MNVLDNFEELIDWSMMQHHDLPWRANRSVYNTLVSEIMLQQTTVGTVKNHFSRFIKNYPTIHKLAQAKEQDVEKDWRGLGFYRRAKNLHKAAREIAGRLKGQIPDDYDSLVKITGIGEYTANAIIAIGHKKKALAVDANIERVLSRIYAIDEQKGPRLQKKLNELFRKGEILNFDFEISFRALNEALMDLGRIYCQANKVSCELCPMAESCKAKLEGKPLAYPKATLELESDVSAPVKKEKKKMTDVHLLRLVIKKDDEVILFERPTGTWLEGQLELPSFVLGRKTTEQFPFLKDFKGYRKLPRFKTFITNHRIHNFVFVTEEDKYLNTKGKVHRIKLSEIEDQNVSTATFKTLRRVGILAKLESAKVAP